MLFLNTFVKAGGINRI